MPDAVTLRLPEAIGISILIGPIALKTSSAITSPAACIIAPLPVDGDLPLSLIIDKSPSICTTKSSPVTSTVAPISAANILPPPLSIICINKPAPKSTAGLTVYSLMSLSRDICLYTLPSRATKLKAPKTEIPIP